MKVSDLIYIFSDKQEFELCERLRVGAFQAVLTRFEDLIIEPCFCVLVSFYSDDRIEQSEAIFLQIVTKIGQSVPLVALVRQPTVKQTVQLIKGGAVTVIEQNDTSTSSCVLLEELQSLYDAQLKLGSNSSLTLKSISPREHQVLKSVILGWSSKAIAESLHIAVSTVDNHRARLMRKLGAESSADLTRIALKLDPSLGNDD